MKNHKWMVTFFTLAIVQGVNASESIYSLINLKNVTQLEHRKDEIPLFMKPLFDQLYLSNGCVSVIDLPKIDSFINISLDNEIYVYHVPRSKIVSDSQAFTIVVDKTDGLYWVEVFGGLVYTHQTFGPGKLPQSQSE